MAELRPVTASEQSLQGWAATESEPTTCEQRGDGASRLTRDTHPRSRRPDGVGHTGCGGAHPLNSTWDDDSVPCDTDASCMPTSARYMGRRVEEARAG